MSLYGRTDSNANVTKAGRGIAASAQAKTVIYVDETEAALEANKERGLNAPGWWSYYTYTDCSGATRHKAEQLVFIAGGDNNANETQTDDATAADTAVTLAVTAQPADVAGAADPYTGNPAFTVSATATGDATGATISVQWQRQTAGSNRWTNITGSLDGGVYSTGLATSAGARVGNLVITGAAKADLDGYKYRAKLTTSTGAKELISGEATLTFA